MPLSSAALAVCQCCLLLSCERKSARSVIDRGLPGRGLARLRVVSGFFLRLTAPHDYAPRLQSNPAIDGGL